MRGLRATIACQVAALALSGCMGRTAPVAAVPPSSLDTIAYGQAYATAPVAVAYAEPAFAGYDTAYHLDAGDRLRVVVYGQEGLTNTYAIDASGAITMPLIDTVPALLVSNTAINFFCLAICSTTCATLSSISASDARIRITAGKSWLAARRNTASASRALLRK